MITIEWLNTDSDKDSMIDLPSTSHTRNKGLEMVLGTCGIKDMNDLPKTFPKKALFAQQLGVFGKK